MSESVGWAGKILRVNLTTGEFSTVDTMQYVPKFIGGLGVAHKIWWDEVPPGVKAFDAENKLIFMNGPATGSVSPTAGRGEFVSISPYSYPEQYANTGIGGALPTYLKWVGYDGIIIEGVSEKPCYLLISEDGPEIRSAEDLWGVGLVDAQELLHERHGENSSTYGIGPAGENLVRFACIGCGIHNATGQGGHGAVMGSKKLKAITVIKGKHQVKMANAAGVMKTTQGFVPIKRHRPWIEENLGDKEKNPFWPAWVPQVGEKPNFAINWMGNVYNKPYKFICHSCTFGCLNGCGFYEFKDVPAATEPKLLHAMTGCNHTRYEQFFHKEEGDPARNFAKGFEVHELATQLGFGHFDIIYGIVPWLYYTKELGIDTESLVGMPTDVRSCEWWLKLLKMIAYRQGFGDQLAEGLKRTVVALGEEEYAHPVYEGPEACRGESWVNPMKLPVAVLGGWGYTARSLTVEQPFPMNLPGMLNWLIDTRDSHHNKWPDWAHKKFWEFMTTEKDPYNSEFPLKWAKFALLHGTLIDCLTVCWLFPLRDLMGWEFEDNNVGYGTFTTGVEARLFSDVTGVQMTEEEFLKAGERINTLFRAIQIRNHDRTADLEYNAVVPQYYWSFDQEKIKQTIGNWYECLGWDRKTGWPTRDTLSALDLDDVAEALEAIGKLPS